jgi:L-threonylcarbamoyladenylate synthase
LYSDKKIGLLLFQNPIQQTSVEHQEILSKSGDLKEAAKNLYAAMHRLDQLGLDVIIAERLPNIGLGNTLNDKLQRATRKNH